MPSRGARANVDRSSRETVVSLLVSFAVRWLRLTASRAGTGSSIVNCVPRPDFALHVDPAAVGFDDLAGRRQAQARAARLGREERLEHVGRRVVVDAARRCRSGRAPPCRRVDVVRTTSCPPSGIACLALSTG